jgi:hypothetical protein
MVLETKKRCFLTEHILGLFQSKKNMQNRHAIQQAGEGSWETKYFAGNAFLSTVYSEFVKHIESLYLKSRGRRHMYQLGRGPGLFCEALQG